MSIVVRGLPGGRREEENPFTQFREERAAAGRPAPRPAPPRVSPTGKPQLPATTSLLKAGAPPPKPDLPWWQDGLGVLINNPVSRNVLQTLDIAGVPQRFIASAAQETLDLFQGEGFSGQDLYDQTNPLFFYHGKNAEDNHGMGKVWADTGLSAGKWGDRFIGFLGDVATDPLTYVAGAGVVDKGLDAARAGGKLAAWAEGGADAARAAAPIAARGKGQGSRASLAGRRTRNTRVAEATNLIRRNIDEAAQPQLLEELQRRSTRGLGARGSNDVIADVVDEALSIDSRQGIRFAKPGGGVTAPLPGTSALMRALSAGVGAHRARSATKGRLLPRFISDAGSEADIEKSMRIFRNAEGASTDDFLRAADQLEGYERARPITGAAHNLLQRAVNKRRSNIMDEVRDAKGRGNYLNQSEKLDAPRTSINELFDYVGEVAAHFGVTLPKLSAPGLRYVPHVYSRKFVDAVSDKEAFATAFIRRFGDEGVETDLLAESGRLSRRNIVAGKHNMGDGFGVVDFGDGSIDSINRAAREKMGFDHDVLETDPVALADEYMQIIAEDIGRRAGRAEQALLGSEYVKYDHLLSGERNDEWQRQYDAARDRLLEEGHDLESLTRFDETIMDANSPVYYDELVEKIDSDSGQAIRSAERKVLHEWRMHSSGQGMLMDPKMQDLWTNIEKEVRNPGSLKRAWNYANNFFKTYALLTPGFHMRNWLSALFMNVADGVPIATSYRGMKLWDKFASAAKEGDDLASGLRWLSKEATPTERKALMSVFASGAGGRFAEAGVAEAVGLSKFLGKAIENPATRASQRAGSWVEGSIRAGMALDTIERGGNVMQATNRISRIHFDYSETSRFDDKMKRLAPFWSFYSRNMPMQLVQQVARPRGYAGFQHFRENFADPSAIPADGEVPDYIEAGGGIPLDLGWFNWFEPDLPHTKVTEDIQRLADAPKNPIGLASHVSPMITAPLEYAMGQNTFTGQTYGADDYTKVGLDSNILNTVLALPPALLTGNLKTGDAGIFISDRLLNAVESVNPLGGQLARLGDTGSERWEERVARYMGMPVRTLTEGQMDSYEYWNRQDEYEQEALRRLLDGE